MKWVLALGVAVTGCGDAITLSIESDRPVPSGLDAICVGVADRASGGGTFGRGYRLEGALAKLPQTLRLEAGDAETAYAWVRGDRGGVPVARAGGTTDFGDDLSLALPRCEVGRAGEPAARGTGGPPNARLAASQGAGGWVVVAAGDTSAVIDADGISDAPVSSGVRAVVAVEIDRDCDDDVIVVSDAAPPIIWRREGTSFVAGASIGDVPAAAVATADVDRDGDADVVVGSGGSLALYLGDGAGAFTRSDGLDASGRLSAVAALAFGDLDGDGNPDLVVGQAGDALYAWLDDPGGSGRFTASEGVVPPVVLDVRSLLLADADADDDPDLLVAVAGAPARIYGARDGRLEDRTFDRLPEPVMDARAIAVGGWDAGCEPDAVFAGAASTALRGGPEGVFEREGAVLPAASDAALVDLDDDGRRDLVLATAEGVTWFAR